MKLLSLKSLWLLPKFWRKVCWRRLDSMLLIQQAFILKESTGISTDLTGLRSQHSRKKESSRFRWHNSTIYIKLWCQILTNICLCSIRECACVLSQVSGYLMSIQRTVEQGPVWITLVSTAPLMTLVLLKSPKWGFYEVHLPKVNLQHDLSTHW